MGSSATSIATTLTSNFFVCGGPLGNVPNVFHAFAWRDGGLNDLGAFPPEAENCSNAGSVNANGEISGTSEISAIDPVLDIKELRAVLWTHGEMISLGTLGGGYSIGGATGAINNRGQVVGGTTNSVPDPYSLFFQLVGSSRGTQTRAFLWQNGQMRDLLTLGGPDAWAFFVNEQGQAAGESYTNGTPNPITGVPNLDPFLWRDGTMLDLGTLGGAFGYPVALNNHGQVVGYSSLAADPGACLTSGAGSPNCDPFLWDQGSLIDLSTTTIGGSPSIVFAINNAGENVGAAVFPNAPFDAYVWRQGIATDLGHLSDCYSLAFAINSHRQIVGGTFSCADGNHTRAFLWENGTMVDLDTLVPADSPLQLVEAVTINDRGEIAGNGVPPGVARRDFNTLRHAFLLIPCDEHHPGVEGCDYSLVEAAAAVSQPIPAIRDAASRTLPPSLQHRMSRYHFPGSAFGPKN